MTLTHLQVELPARYRVLRHVATGGMAAVYAAVDEVLGREVAVKVLSGALTADDAARRRFTREARAAARVSHHPHVVTIYDIAETAGTPPAAFIVMELLTGGTVADRLRAREPIPHALALRWLEQAGSALDAAHATGMVHRDVKPANLLLDEAGALKVGDFGIATLTSEAPLTMTGQVVGTAAYFSPEQALGKPATAASDRYALAVVAFELLTGHRPFTQSAPAAQALAHVEAAPPAATALAPGLPPAVDDVLARGLAKEPSARPATAAALVADLQGALGPTAATGVAVPAEEATTVAARPPSTPRPRRAAPPARVPVEPAAARPVPRRGRGAALAALLGLLLAAGILVAVLAGSGGGSPARRSATTHPATTGHHRRASHTTPTTATQAPPTTTAPPAAAPSGAPADAAGIEQQAHAALAAGDYQGAIAQLRGLVNRCDVQITDPCAYAWYDYGDALLRAGDPQAAIPVLEHRLENPDQHDVVQSTLDQARAAASGGQPAPAPGPGKAQGKGHGHGGPKPGKDG